MILPFGPAYVNGSLPPSAVNSIIRRCPSRVDACFAEFAEEDDLILTFPKWMDHKPRLGGLRCDECLESTMHRGSVRRLASAGGRRPGQFRRGASPPEGSA